jgi:hypothetical protein
MPEKTYRVIQWATGHVGKVAIRHFAENPVYELVGVLVTNPKKVGKDAGEIARIGPIGMLATDDAEAIVAMDADCVHFAPSVHDLDMVCRLLRSSKNVICPVGPFFPWERWKPDFEKLAAACEEGGTSFHGSGIHPGFAGDLLPLTVARIMDRIDHIHLYETIDHLANPSNYIEFMGFGREPADLLANPGRSPEAPYMFAQSMEIVARGLGLTIGQVTAKFDVATAVRDIEYPRGVIKQGTVAGQHYEWTGWADDGQGARPLISYHCFWTMGADNIEPRWDCGASGYRLRIEGDPPMELTMARPVQPGAATPYLGLPWTAMAGVNVIPAVCDAAPGVVTHFELGLPQLRGLFR